MMKKIFKSRIVGLVGILLFIGVCMGAGSIIAYVEHMANPTDYGAEYFRAFMLQDYDKMYDMIEKKEGYYISKERYKEIMKHTRELNVIDSYKINEPIKENGKYVLNVICTDNTSGTEQEFNIYMTKINSFPKIKPSYKISIDKMIVENLNIKIPASDNLKINGKEVKNIDYTEENGVKEYNVAGLLNGNYEITCENSMCAKNTTVNVMKKGCQVDLTTGEYTANDNYTEKISKDITHIIEKYYESARNRKKNSKILKECFKDKNVQKAAIKALKKTIGILYKTDKKNIDKYSVKEFQIKDIKKKILYNEKNKNFEVIYTYNYDFVCATEVTTYTSYVEKYSGSCQANLKLTYSVEGENISVTKMSLKEKEKY